jgi:hypothetical protein
MEWSDLAQLLHHTWAGALRFDSHIYSAQDMDDATRLVSFLIVVAAGASLLLGQCFALFLVSASPLGFLLGLAFNGMSLAIRLGVWVTASVFVASLLFDTVLPPWNFISIIFIATSPLVFGFLGMLPSIGFIVVYFLYGWTSLSIMFALFHASKIPFLSGALCALSGWIFVSLLERLVFSKSKTVKDGGFLFASRRLSRYSSAEIFEFVRGKVLNK